MITTSKLLKEVIGQKRKKRKKLKPIDEALKKLRFFNRMTKKLENLGAKTKVRRKRSK